MFRLWAILRITSGSTALWQNRAIGFITRNATRQQAFTGSSIKIRDPDDFFIYKIHTDGTGRTQVRNTRTNAIAVIGDWIYYIIKQAGNGGMLYKTRLDRTERVFVFTLVEG